EVTSRMVVTQVILVGVSSDADIFIRTGRELVPHHLAGGEVVRREGAAGSELVTAEADEHFAFRNQRGRRAVFTLVRVVVLDDPGLFAGLRVERDQPAVEGQVDDLAVAESTTAVDGVAASARNSRFITIGLLDVVPDFLWVVRVGQVERLNDVRPRAEDVHHRRAVDVDDERLTFMTAQSAGRLVPGELKVLNVMRV